jgi:hypothetical protein
MILPSGAWNMNDSSQHGGDEGLAKALITFFKKEKVYDVIDIGCGDGFYLKRLIRSGIRTYGYDGNPNTTLLTEGYGLVADFSVPQFLEQASWGLCIDVGEHVPPEYEDIFLENLNYHSVKGLVLSWAIRGQGGYGHYNCKDVNEVIKLMNKFNLKVDEENTLILRNSTAKYPDSCWWLGRSTLVLRRQL